MDKFSRWLKEVQDNPEAPLESCSRVEKPLKNPGLKTLEIKVLMTEWQLMRIKNLPDKTRQEKKIKSAKRQNVLKNQDKIMDSSLPANTRIGAGETAFKRGGKVFRLMHNILVSEQRNER